MIVTIVGAGRMGRGIATRALTGGHEVLIVDHTPAKAEALASDLRQAFPAARAADLDVTGAVKTADVVVLAVAYPAAQDMVREAGTDLDGKVVVDISNPVDFATMDSLTTPPGSSAAELIAGNNPRARVVKAFNTTFAGTLVTGEVAGQPLDVFIAGDDQAAKDAVAELATSGGLRALDVGPLRRARELEALGLLNISMQGRLDLGFSSAIKILP